MGLFKCWGSGDVPLRPAEESPALMSGPLADTYSPVIDIERSVTSAESQVSPLHSNRDWDWAQQGNGPLVGASNSRGSSSGAEQNVKSSARASSAARASQDARTSSSDTKAAAGLTEYSLQNLPGDTRSDFFVVLRVESDVMQHSAHYGVPNGRAPYAKPACLPGTAMHSKPEHPSEYTLSPVFVSRRAMTGFTIMQVRDFATVLRSQLLRDPLMAYALQRALRYVTSQQPRSVNHVLTDEDAGGPSFGDDTKDVSLHVLQLLPCRWALSHRSGSSSTPVPALLLSYYLPHMPPPSAHLVNAGSGGFGQVMPQLRDACILERVPNVVTLVDIMGRVLYQNEASLAYMGDWSSAHCAETMASVAEHIGRNGRRNSCIEDSVGCSTSSDGSVIATGACGTAPPRSVLAQLLALEPSCSREILDAVLSGQNWSRTVRVPASLKGRLFSAAAIPDTDHGYGSVLPSDSRVSSSSQSPGVAPEDEEAVFVGCFTVRAKGICEVPHIIAAEPSAAVGTPFANGGHHLKPTAPGDAGGSGKGAGNGYSTGLSPLGMQRTGSVGDSLTSVGTVVGSARPLSGGIALRYDSVGSFLIPSGRMDSRSDGPQRRIVALLGGATNSSIMRRNDAQGHSQGASERGHSQREGRGGSLPKPVIAPIEALQRLSSSHSEPMVVPPISAEGGAGSDSVSTSDTASEMTQPAPPHHQPKKAFGTPGHSLNNSQAVSRISLLTAGDDGTPPSGGAAAGAGKRISFWDNDDQASSAAPSSAPSTTSPTAPASHNNSQTYQHHHAPPGSRSNMVMGRAPSGLASESSLTAERSSPNASLRGRGLLINDSTRTRRASSTGVVGSSSGTLARNGSTVTKSQDASEFMRDRGPDLWHELHAIPLTDPILDKPAILLVQMDVTRMVLSEERLGDLTDAQLSMLEQLFPRHVIEYMLSHAPSTLSRNLGQLASYHPQVTITFFDIVGFTSMSRSADARQVLVFLNELYTRFDELIDKHQLYKIDVVGDCYIVCAGLITKDVDGFERVQMDGDVTPEEAAWQARSVMAFSKSILQECKKIKMPNGERTQLRMGLHCGPVVSGLVGPKMPKFTCFGDSMNFASRMESTGKPGCIQASAAIAHLIPEERWVLTSGVQVKGIGIVDTYMWSPEEEVPLLLASPSQSGLPSQASNHSAAGGAAAGAAAAGAAGGAGPGAILLLPEDSERNSVIASFNGTNRRISITDCPIPEDTEPADEGPGSLMASYSKATASTHGSTRLSRPPSGLVTASSSGSGPTAIGSGGGSGSAAAYAGPPPAPSAAMAAAAAGNASGHMYAPMSAAGNVSGNTYPGLQSRRVGNNLSRHASISRPQSGRGLRNQMTISHNDPLAHSLLTVLAHIRETYPSNEDSDED